MTTYKKNAKLCEWDVTKKDKYITTRDKARIYRIYHNGTMIWKGENGNIDNIILTHHKKQLDAKKSKIKNGEK